MKRTFLIALASLLLRSAFAGIISEPENYGAWAGISAQPFGQTFTADDTSLVSASFWLNGNSLAGHTLFTYSLLFGSGTNGPVLASSTFSVPYGFGGEATANFTSAFLTVGQQYTLLISSTDSPHWEVGFVQTDLPGAVDYTGGDAIISGKIVPNIDLSFQIVTAPEPSLPGLLACGAGVAASLRRLTLGRCAKM